MYYILPLEPMEERYTEQWYRWFSKYCSENKIEFTYIDGEQVDSSVEVGTVLDAAGTNIWKFTQLEKCMRLFKTNKIKNGDVFFTMDLWHPGLEAIKYTATLYHLDIKIYGFLHAGSYTTEDFAEPMALWAIWFEIGWAKMVDGIFVGSEYHKNKFCNLRYSSSHKVYVTGNPFSTSEVRETIKQPVQKEKIVIYPNRFDREKRPNVFIDLMNLLWEKRQDFEVYLTTSRKEFKSNDPAMLDKLRECNFPCHIFSNLSKEEYYNFMAQSQVYVSTTIEENFGYCLVEALTLDTYPVVINDFSHVEILQGNKNHLYDDEKHFLSLMDRALDSKNFKGLSLVERYNDSIKRMFEIMENQ